MSILEKKITLQQIEEHSVASAPDDLTGKTASEVKAIFDKLPSLHIEQYNSLIDLINSPVGAEQIGSKTGETIQHMLDKSVNSDTIKSIRVNEKNQLEGSKNSIDYGVIGNDGHRILDGEGIELPHRLSLKFTGGVTVEDDPDNDQTIINAYYSDEQLRSVQTYTATHAKSGTVHSLTGLPTLSGLFTVQFIATADYTSGDTFTGYTAKATGEDTALPDKAFITGDLVSITVDTINKKLGFKLGGGGGVKPKIYVQTTEPTGDIADGAYWIKDSGYSIDTVYVDTIQPDTLLSDGIFVQCSTTYLKFPYVVSKNMTIDGYFRFAQVFRNGAWDDAEVSVRTDGQWVTRSRNSGFLYYSLNIGGKVTNIYRYNTENAQLLTNTIINMQQSPTIPAGTGRSGGVKNRAFVNQYEVSNTGGDVTTSPANMEIIAQANIIAVGGSNEHLLQIHKGSDGYVWVDHLDVNAGTVVKSVKLLLWASSSSYIYSYSVGYDDVLEKYTLMRMANYNGSISTVGAVQVVITQHNSVGTIVTNATDISSTLFTITSGTANPSNFYYPVCEAYNGRIFIGFTHVGKWQGYSYTTYSPRVIEYTDNLTKIKNIYNYTGDTVNYVVGTGLAR